MSPAPAPLLAENDRKEVIRLYTEMGAKYDEHDAAIKAGKPVGEIKAAIEKIDAALAEITKKYESLAERASKSEEILLRRSMPAEPAKSIGAQFVEAEGFKNFIASGSRGAFTLTVKGSLWEVKDIVGLSRTLPELQPGVIVGARLPIGVRSLIPQGRTTAGAVQYVSETSFTNNAAPVAEGAAKPKSDKAFTSATLPVETIAHYFKVSRQSYDDLPFIASQIEQNGIWGVKKVEDNQLLNGTGTSPQLKGIMPIATAAPAPGTGATLIDAIGSAVFDLASKGYMADGTVVNPADWGAVAMLKNSQGNYLFANPMDYAGNSRIWGTRLVASTHMAAGSFLVGAFQGNSLLLDRDEVNVQVATQNEDDFLKNMLTLLVEERLVLLIYNVAAFEKGVKPVGLEGREL